MRVARFGRRTLGTAVGAVMLATLVAAGPAPKLLPVPPEPEQAKVGIRVREIYKADYADASPAGRAKLARRLLADARATDDSPAAKYVMLAEARDVAAGAGDLDLTLESIGEMGTRFDTDVTVAQVEAVRRVGKSSVNPKGAKAIAGVCLTLADIHAGIGHLDTAQQLADLGAQAARGANSPESAALARERAADFRALAPEYARAQPAMRQLKANPADRVAAATVARFDALVRGDWEAALPRLAAGPAGPLHDLAAEDLRGPTTSAEQAALADRYWKFRDSLAPALRPNLSRRAATWYARALPKLSGLTRVAAEKAIADARAEAVATTLGRSVLGAASYRRFDGPVSWHVAGALCAQAGGRLVVIPNDDVHKLTVALAAKRNTWIGCTDEAKEGTWVWVDGSPVKYARWGANQPDNSGGAQNYGFIWAGHKGDEWDDGEETARYGFICEWGG